MPRRIAIADLEAAINRARAAQPASGPESTLTLEVATLAALYGRLIWEHRESVVADDLADTERVALQLWLAPSAHRADPEAPGASPGRPASD
jgi:hypothetical protein